MKILIQYIKPFKGLVLLAFLLAAINQTFSLFDPMIFGKLIDEFAKIGLDTARSILNQDVADLVRRTDLEEETILEVIRILKEEIQD